MGKKKVEVVVVPTNLKAALEIFLENMKKFGKDAPPMQTTGYKLEPQHRGFEVKPNGHYDGIKNLRAAEDAFTTLLKVTKKKVTLRFYWGFGGERRWEFTSVKSLEQWKRSDDGESVIIHHMGDVHWSCSVVA